MEETADDILTPDETFRTTLCPQCKFPIQPNSSNSCVKCMRSKNDITLWLHKTHYLQHCPHCKTYRDPPKSRIKLQFQSKQFLSFCIKQLENYLSSKDVTLLRSQTIPTPPDSDIIKIRVYVQKEVPNGETLQQSYVVEFSQHNHICEPCTRVQPNPNQWNSVVQLRKPACGDRFSFYHLEHVLLKHCVTVNDVRINKLKHGVDFFFPNRNCANNFLDFIKRQAPVRISESKGSVSQVTKSNSYSYRYNFSVEVCPINREDLIFLPPKVALNLGIGPIVICTMVTNVITLFDPLTSKQCCLDGDMYWNAPFKSLLTRKELVEYVVLDVKKVCCSAVTIDGGKSGLANVEVAREKDLGKNDTRFNIKTHLGYLLKTGDSALGYDLWEANCSDSEIELKEHIGGGVILMRKTYGLNRLMKRRVEHQLYLKDLEEITNEVLGISLGGEEPPLEEKLGDLNLSGEEHKEKKARRGGMIE